MMILINAFKSISRAKARNVLIGIIVLAIAASCCVSLAIRNAAQEAELLAEREALALEEQARIDKEKTRSEITSLLNITGSISIDRARMMEEIEANIDKGEQGGKSDRGGMRRDVAMIKNPEMSLLKEYANTDYVSNFYWSSSVSLNSADEEIEPYSDGSNSQDDFFSKDSKGSTAVMPSGAGMPGGGGRVVAGGLMIAQGDFTVTGYSGEQAMTKFQNGTAVIKDGEMFDMDSDSMDCIISDVLASWNNLSVGDELVLANPNATETEGDYTFTIVGIYTDLSASETGDMPMFSTAQDPSNLIGISLSSLQAILENSTNKAETSTNDWDMEITTALMTQDAHTFVFADFEKYESFKSLIETNHKEEYYTVNSSDVEEYNKQIAEIENTLANTEISVTPIQNLSEFATTLFFVILAVGSVILIVINVFNIRERKYEVGVLTAIGIKKSKVALQFVVELLCVTFIAIVVGAGVGAFASVPVAENLLSEQISQAKEQDEAKAEALEKEKSEQKNGFIFEWDGNMVENATKEVTYMEQINATFNFTILLQLIAIGIALTIISSLAAVVFVMRYEPLKILANR